MCSPFTRPILGLRPQGRIGGNDELAPKRRRLRSAAFFRHLFRHPADADLPATGEHQPMTINSRNDPDYDPSMDAGARSTDGRDAMARATSRRASDREVAAFVAPFQVDPDSKVRLAKDFDPAFKGGVTGKQDGKELLRSGLEVLAEFQARLYAQRTRSVLVVLQALDAAGKDGAIKHVMGAFNPQGVSVHSFKAPSGEELEHDFLWRYEQRLPARGMVGIFNRSHYEEVLVVRVHKELLERQNLPKSARGPGIWKRRYQEINEWERRLTDNGIRLVKLFLNLSKEEQRLRLLRRIDLPDHNWKFSAADYRERERWDDYQKAFSEMLSHTSTQWAPWYVIPADRKWFARMSVAAVIANALIELGPRYPTVSVARRDEMQQVKRELEAEAPMK
jgi:PPK2 family polyphosphate:nucleotide phosphotransferase